MKAAVVGTFDGLHRGHQHLLNLLKQESAKRELQPVVITFKKHPMSLLNPDSQPERLSDINECKEKIEKLGIKTIVLEFNKILQQMSAEEFLEKIHKDFDVNLFLIGFNNKIGADRKGAKELSGKKISGVEIIAADEHPALPVSSSLIREALRRGDITSANRMLGHPYTIKGKVISGKQIGRTIGFPTANLHPSAEIAIPAEGVYVGRVLDHIAVVNIGRRPTIEGYKNAPISIEAHIVDFNENIYNQTISIQFLCRLRDEKKFSSIDELKDAIEHDILAARNYEQ